MARRRVLDSDDDDEEEDLGDVKVAGRDSGSDDAGNSSDQDEEDDRPLNGVIDLEADDSDEDSEQDNRPLNGFIDLEAEDSEEEENSEEEEEDEDGPRKVFIDLEADDDSNDDESEDDEEIDIDPFPFMRLPPELRIRIWQLFCPDLVAKARVLHFCIGDASPTMRPLDLEIGESYNTVWEGRALEEQTFPLRMLMGIHQESRALGTSKYPTVVPIDSEEGERGLVRVAPTTDIMLFESCEWHLEMDGFCSLVQNLAITLDAMMLFRGEHLDAMQDWLQRFPNLQRLFIGMEDSFARNEEPSLLESLGWCSSNYVHSYRVETKEKETGYGEDTETIYVWPNILDHGDFARVHISKEPMRAAFPSNTDVSEEPITLRVEYWPLVAFEDRRIRILDKIMLGIEDDDHDDGHFSDLPLELDGEEANEYESDGIDDTENPAIYDSDDDGIIDLDGDDDDGNNEVQDEAQFSSPEPEPEPEPDRDHRRGRKRRVVEDEDEDEDEGSENAGESSRRKRARMVSDSDDDDEEIGGKAANEVQVISDDSDEEPVVKNGKKKKRIVIQSDTEDEDEEDDDGQPKKMTLAQRLKLKKPVVISDEDDDEGDEEDEEEDEEEEEGGFIDGIAIESNDEDEGDHEDESSYF